MSQYRVHSRTKKRLAYLEGKKCYTCKENRSKALTINTSGNVICYNCKAQNKVRKYQFETINPHMNTKRRWVFINKLGRKCHTCGDGRIQALQVVNEKKELRCKNCLKAGLVFKYDNENT